LPPAELGVDRLITLVYPAVRHQAEYVTGIRNMLLDIFSGADQKTVEDNWALLEAKVALTRNAVAELPIETIRLPLRNGSFLNETVKCRPKDAGCFYPQPLLEEFQRAADCCAPTPPLPLAHYVGTYTNGYYGKLEVSSSGNSSLRLQYGSMNCTLFPVSSSAMLCLTNLLLGLMVVTFDADAQQLITFGGTGTFKRQGGSSSGSALVRGAAGGRLSKGLLSKVPGPACVKALFPSANSPFLQSPGCIT
jgi:hypothetical protein